nr:hypothetical protein CFP56_23355 [Quercus suber]
MVVSVEALIHAEVKAQAQDSKADDRATEADDRAAAPNSFLKDSSGNFTGESNPEYTSWRSREQALFTFINSRLSSKKKVCRRRCRTHAKGYLTLRKEALIHAEVKAQAQDSKADDRATEADDRAAGKRPVA